MEDPNPNIPSAPNPLPDPSSPPKYTYPPPFTVAPTSTHTQTIILLHGRGGAGQSFGEELLSSPLTCLTPQSPPTLAHAFPNTKFIFPTAKRRRAKRYNRTIINQWFDGIPINEQQDRHMSREEEGWQLEGLQETAEFLRGIVNAEVKLVGARNVVLGGLSQGCAMGFHFLLSYTPSHSNPDAPIEPLAGFIGMSGWMPFSRAMLRLLDESADESADEDNPFSPSPSVSLPVSAPLTPAQKISSLVRENMFLDPAPGHATPFLATPVLLGHGMHDIKVLLSQGLQARDILECVGMHSVKWIEYDEGHWYKVPEQVDDIVRFLRGCFRME